MAAFVNPPMTDPLHPRQPGAGGKYGDYDYSRLQALDPSNAPSPPRVASQGALPAGPAPAASSPAPGAFKPDEGKGVGEARKPAMGKSFFDIWAEGSMEDKQQVADRQEEMLKAKDMDLESATMQMIRNGGEPARMLAEKFGITGTGEDGLAFRDPASVFEERGEKGKKKLDKAKQRAAMGGFLMEMGLRILQSDKQSAGGQIAEGALGTMEATRQRKTEAEDRAIAKAELERQRQAAEEKARRDEERLKLERRRVEDTEERTDIQRAEAERDPNDTRAPYLHEVQWEQYKKLIGGLPDNRDKTENELYQEFLNQDKKLTKWQRERLINSQIEAIDEAILDGLEGPEGWSDMTANEKRELAAQMMDIDSPVQAPTSKNEKTIDFGSWE